MKRCDGDSVGCDGHGETILYVNVDSSYTIHLPVILSPASLHAKSTPRSHPPKTEGS